jgi:hypothetical protein
MEEVRALQMGIALFVARVESADIDRSLDRGGRDGDLLFHLNVTSGAVSVSSPLPVSSFVAA